MTNVHHSNDMKIHKWFYNHYACPKCQYTKFTQKWSTRNAFFQLNHDEIMELETEMSGKQPGQPGFLGDLQDTTTTLLNNLLLRIWRNMLRLLKNGSRSLHQLISNPGLLMDNLP